jgi:hypothetical protein
MGTWFRYSRRDPNWQLFGLREPLKAPRGFPQPSLQHQYKEHLTSEGFLLSDSTHDSHDAILCDRLDVVGLHESIQRLVIEGG